jgi:LPXTG-motif cell wall-anchored protein
MLARHVSTLSGLVLFGLSLTPSLKADQWDKKTILTVNEAIQLPTVVLEPGKYVFKLLDSLSDRHIVQVFNSDETHLITTVLAIPNYKLAPSGKSDFRFWETPAGQPRAMRAWFYPGDNFGQEFAYPKSKSVEIARVTNEPVPTVMLVEEAELKTAPIVVVDEKGNEAPLKVEVAAAAPAVAPAPEPVAERAAPAPEPEPAKLPDTGSPYPLIAIIGLASLAIYGLMSYRSGRAS